MFRKKGISPVVAITLLVVTTVVSVVAFQVWFNNYSSSVFSNTEQKSNIDSLKIVDLIDTTLYIKIDKNNTNINKIKIGDNECSGDFSGLPIGVTEIDISYCLRNVTNGKENVLVVTDNAVLSSYFLVESIDITYCDNSLVLLMHFNNDSNYGENDTFVYDFSGSNNHGTNVNTTWTSNGKFGGAYDFNLENTAYNPGEGYINLGSDSSLKNTVFTYSAWVYALPTNFNRYIFGGSDSGDLHGFGIADSITGSQMVIERIGFEYVNSSVGVTENSWSHILAIYNETSDEYRMYVNGNLIENGTHSSTLGAGSPNFIIGNRLPTNLNIFNGTIDEVAIWNRELTETEIKTIYNSNSGMYC